MAETELSLFLDQHLWEIIIAGGVIVGFIFLYRMMRKVPVQPDYVRVFHDLNMKDEELNKPNRFDPKVVYHGSEALGKIISLDTQEYDYKPTEEEKDRKKGYIPTAFKKSITTIVFQRLYLKYFPVGEKFIIHIAEDEYKVDGKKLVIPQEIGLTALGNQFLSKTSFDKTGHLVDGSFQKRLFESNVNVMASRMSHISSESPEMAFQLNMKRLEIDKIRAEKETKMGGLI